METSREYWADVILRREKETADIHSPSNALFYMFRIYWPCFLVLSICLSMSSYYAYAPLDEPIGLGFNVIRQAVHYQLQALRWNQFGAYFTMVFFILRSRKVLDV